MSKYGIIFNVFANKCQIMALLTGDTLAKIFIPYYNSIVNVEGVIK